MNHWIGLTRAALGRPPVNDYALALEACRGAVGAGTAWFPLSMTHYFEMQQIRDASQRRDVARLMEELSGFRTLLGRPALFRLEIDAALNRIFGLPYSALQSRSLVGRGVGHAYGSEWSPRIRNSLGVDVADEVRRAWSGGEDLFDQQLPHWQMLFERSVLRGPMEDEAEYLTSLGYRTDRVAAVIQRRTAQEAEFASLLDADGKLRRGRTRDAVSARELAIELFDALRDGLTARRVTPSEWARRVSRIETARWFIDSMPTTDVAVTLKTAGHRNASKRWSRNDVHDVDGLSNAVPYCDVVVTEKYAHRVLATSSARRAGTVILRNVLDLIPIVA